MSSPSTTAAVPLEDRVPAPIRGLVTHTLNSIRFVIFLLSLLASDSAEARSRPSQRHVPSSGNVHALPSVPAHSKLNAEYSTTADGTSASESTKTASLPGSRRSSLSFTRSRSGSFSSTGSGGGGKLFDGFGTSSVSSSTFASRTGSSWFWLAGNGRRIRREMHSAVGFAFGWLPIVLLTLLILLTVIGLSALAPTYRHFYVSWIRWWGTHIWRLVVLPFQQASQSLRR